MHEQRQWFMRTWAGATAMVLLAAVAVIGRSNGVTWAVLIPVAALLLALNLRVEVDREIRIRLFPIRSRTLRLQDVAALEVVGYKWWWGYGLRLVPGATVYSTFGTRALRIGLPGRDVIVQCKDPEALQIAIEQARQATSA